MCEPAHSIVQIPDDFDDTDLPFGDNIPKAERLKRLLKGTWKKIGKWFHISKMGSGHSEATGFGRRELQFLGNPERDYEGLWWYRTFKEDPTYHYGSLIQRPVTEPEALRAAKEYHDLVCMQNIKVFRRFFETSLRKTTRAHGYIDRLLTLVLNTEGRRQLGANRFIRRYTNILTESQIKTVMGYTRRRGLFIPEWADDDNFWGKRGGVDG